MTESLDTNMKCEKAEKSNVVDLSGDGGVLKEVIQPAPEGETA